MARRDDVADLEEFGRFAEPALLILVSLADGPKHGYAITEDIADFVVPHDRELQQRGRFVYSPPRSSDETSSAFSSHLIV